MTQIDVDRFRTMLQEERERVAGALAYLEKETPGSMEDETGDLVSGSADQHMADNATETYDRELDYTLEENDQTVLAEIDAALERTDQGTYGVCTRCGKPISEERLEAMPWAALCIDCKRLQERG